MRDPSDLSRPRPEIDKANRIDADGAYPVRVGDSTWLCLEFGLDSCKAPDPGATVSFALPPFGFAEFIEIEHLLPVVFSGSLRNPLPLALKQFDHAALLGKRPFGKAALRPFGIVLSTTTQVGQEIRDVGLRRSSETIPDLIRNAVLACFVERRLQRHQCCLLAYAAVGCEPFTASFGIDPTCRDRHQLFVKARSAWTVDLEPTEQHNSRDRIRSYR